MYLASGLAILLLATIIIALGKVRPFLSRMSPGVCPTNRFIAPNYR